MALPGNKFKSQGSVTCSREILHMFERTANVYQHTHLEQLAMEPMLHIDDEMCQLR